MKAGLLYCLLSPNSGLLVYNDLTVFFDSNQQAQATATMNFEDSIPLYAELALALAGFAGIVSLSKACCEAYSDRPEE